MVFWRQRRRLALVPVFRRYGENQSAFLFQTSRFQTERHPRLLNEQPHLVCRTTLATMASGLLVLVPTFRNRRQRFRHQWPFLFFLSLVAQTARQKSASKKALPAFFHY